MKVINKLLELGATQIVTVATIIGLAVLPFAFPFLPAAKRDEIYQIAVLVAVLKLTLEVGATFYRVRSLDQRTRGAAEDFSLIAPPYNSQPELLKALENARGGTLKLICYGTNRFGLLLDVVRNHFPQLKTAVLVCAPDVALCRTDSIDIKTVLADLQQSSNITVETTSVLPTIRAALLRSSSGTPVWASISMYLIHKGRRGLKSEGLSPVLISQEAGSPHMQILSAFVDAEFERLRRPSQPPQSP
jgi:hypothetical protein